VKRIAVVVLYTVLGLAIAGLGAYLAVALLVERTPEVEVPDLTGRSLSQAVDMLQGTGLDLEVRDFVYSDTVPENHIVAQRPRPGARVKAGRGVGVVLSRGPETHPVPDLRGLSLEDARIRLEEAGLVGRTEARVPMGQEGEVVAQGVEPGRRLPRGAVVPLVVSPGPRPVRLRMPRLERLPLGAALERIDRLGLRVDRVEEVKLVDPALAGRVVGQSPLPGFPAEKGAGVALTVAGAVPDLYRARARLLYHALPPGFGKSRVVLTWRSRGRMWTLYDEWVPRGRVVRLVVPVGPGDRATLTVDGRRVLEAGGPGG